VQDAPCREPADAANHQVGDGAGRQQKDEDLAVSTRYARPQSPTVMVKVSRADVAGSAVMAARRPANVAHLTSGPAGQRPPRYLHHSALVQSQDKTQGRKGNEAARVGNPLDERHRPAVPTERANAGQRRSAVPACYRRGCRLPLVARLVLCVCVFSI